MPTAGAASSGRGPATARPFHFTWRPPADPSRPRAPPAPPDGGPEPPPAGRPLVLVVEDDPRAAELLRVYLTEAAYAVEIARDGRTGLAKAAAIAPSAVILDILLPDIDGWEVLQKLKTAPATQAIPVVVVSVV